MDDYARLDRARLAEALDALGRVLADRGLRYRVVVLGGSALLLAEGSTRPTQDVDVAAVDAENAPLRRVFELPKDLTEAIRDVAATLGLPADWMNAGAVRSSRVSCPTGTRSDCGRTRSAG